MRNVPISRRTNTVPRGKSFESGKWMEESQSMVNGEVVEQSNNSEQWAKGDPKVKEMLDYNQFDMIDSRPPEWGWTNEMPRYRGPRDIERDMEQTRQRFWTENRLPMEQYKRSLLDEPQPLSRPLMQRRLLPDPPAWTVDRPFAPPTDFGTSARRPTSPAVLTTGNEIVNTDTGFIIRLDVSQFRPEDVKVSLRDQSLRIDAEREERGEYDNVRRSLGRQFNIPTDIDLDSINSTMNEHGLLTVRGNRRRPKGWKETDIPVQILNRQKPFDGRYQSVKSNVDRRGHASYSSAV